MGKVKKPWQDTQGVLGMFGEKLGAARRAVRGFVEKGIAAGEASGSHGRGPFAKRGGMGRGEGAKRREGLSKERRKDSGGWGFRRARAGICRMRPWKGAMRLKPTVLTYRPSLPGCRTVLGVKPEEVWAEGKYRRIVEARSLIVLLGGEGAGGAHVFAIPKAGDIDPVCK